MNPSARGRKTSGYNPQNDAIGEDPHSWSTPGPSRNLFPLLRGLAVCALLVLIVVGLQIWSGAYASETGRRSDESAHLLNGLVFRDYIATGLGTNPLSFVLRFYLHYPAVAPAIWPPIYHFALGFWMLVAGGTVTSAMLFQAIVGGAVLYAVLIVGRRGLGWPLAILLCALTLTSMMFWRLLCVIMIDPALVGGSLLFAIAYLRFAADPTRRNMILAGLAGGVWAILKVNGMAVAPAIVIAWLLTPKPRPHWKLAAGAGAIAVAIGLPFNVLASIVFAMHKPPVEPGLAAMASRLHEYGFVLHRELGSLMLAIAFAAIAWSLFNRFTNRAVDTLDLTLIAVLAGVVIFHVWIPAGLGDRYMLPAIPILFYFCARFCLNVASLARLSNRTQALAALLLVAASAVYATTAWRPYYFGPIGLRAAAEWIRSQPIQHPLRVLILGKEQSETAFVVEMATADPSRTDYVMRGTKLISESTWVGGGYKLQISSPDVLASKIEAIGFEYVVFDRGALKDPYREHELANQMLTASPDRFPIVWRTQPNPKGPTRDVVVYKVAHPANPPTDRIRYNLSRSIGGEIADSAATP